MLETTLADRPAKTASPRKSPDARNLRRQVSLWGGRGGGGCLPRKASSLHVPEWLNCQHPVAGL